LVGISKSSLVEGGALQTGYTISNNQSTRGVGRSGEAVVYAVDPPFRDPVGADDGGPAEAMQLAVHIPRLDPLRPGDGRAVGTVEQAVEIPRPVPIGPNDGRAVEAVEPTVDPPRLAAVRPGDGRAVDPMELAVESPLLQPIGVNSVDRLGFGYLVLGHFRFLSGGRWALQTGYTISNNQTTI